MRWVKIATFMRRASRQLSARTQHAVTGCHAQALAAGCLYFLEMAEDSRSTYFHDRTAARGKRI